MDKKIEYTGPKNRVYTLYRVSTLGQVEKDDIPMQKQAAMNSQSARAGISSESSRKRHLRLQGIRERPGCHSGNQHDA